MLIACRDFSKGEIICEIEGTTPAIPKTYTSVQVSNTDHIELNSDLVFMNHSCDPTVILDTDTMTVIAASDIKKGDNMTFFYPASEWDMEQPFPCWCCSQQCIKHVQGAKFLSKETLARYLVTHHIQKLLAQREA
ncbi:hypothetical protein EC991_005846 [Linnemannia zychae]|nr:hypothetical protein EC991_005846 [Linnemannia zychae]